jgi:hypothetical protein
MTILLQHPITEKPKKPGEYWFQFSYVMLSLLEVPNIEKWDLYSKGAIYWYEPIELPDDAIIVQ